MKLQEKRSIRVAILDLYEGVPNQGMRCIREILNQYAEANFLDIMWMSLKCAMNCRPLMWHLTIFSFQVALPGALSIVKALNGKTNISNGWVVWRSGIIIPETITGNLFFLFVILFNSFAAIIE